MAFLDFLDNWADDFQTGLSYFKDVLDSRTPFRTSQEYGRDLRAAGNTIPPVVPPGHVIPRRTTMQPTEIIPYKGGSQSRLLPSHPYRHMPPEKPLQASAVNPTALLQALRSLMSED